jgi:prepilin signal peptidase PulO-like enzyme (type II secretory pathway)
VEEARQYSAVSDVAYIFLFLLIAAFIAVYCSRKTLREWRTGEAQGVVRNYGRDTSPFNFWTVIYGHAAGAIAGAICLLFGIIYIVARLGWIN